VIGQLCGGLNKRRFTFGTYHAMQGAVVKVLTWERDGKRRWRQGNNAR
jgi:hypothetical protein